MIKVLGKLGLSSGAVVGVTSLSNPVLSNLPIKPQIEKRTTISDITKFEDISIYAKQRGCILSFENQWKHNTSYSPEQFIREEQKSLTFNHDSNTWKAKMIDYFKDGKFECKPGSATVFFYYDHTGQFVLDSNKIKNQTSWLESNKKIRQY